MKTDHLSTEKIKDSWNSPKQNNQKELFQIWKTKSSQNGRLDSIIYKTKCQPRIINFSTNLITRKRGKITDKTRRDSIGLRGLLHLLMKEIGRNLSRNKGKGSMVSENG